MATFFIKAPNWEPLKCLLTGEWINKCDIYLSSGILFSHKKRIKSGVVVQACNPSYSEGEDREECSSWPASGKSSQDFI
jgi:hypothetical protein